MDLDGQVNNIRLIKHYLNGQLDNAIVEKNKNFKLYRNMGVLARTNNNDYFNIRVGGNYGDTIIV
jgi:hypothetical protein